MIVAAGVILAWCLWVSDSTLSTQVAVAEVRQELKSEIKAISGQLSMHYGLLKEIRQDQKKRRTY